MLIFGPRLGEDPLYITNEEHIVTTPWVTALEEGEFTIDIPKFLGNHSETSVLSAVIPGLNVLRSTYRITLNAEEGEEEVYCGNGIREEGEECDGLDFGNKRCPNFGNPRFDGGLISCTGECTFDTSHCIYGDDTYSDALCGDIVIDYTYGLVCETNHDAGPEDDLLGQMAPPDFGCRVFGYTGGTLKCSSDCASFDVSDCEGAEEPTTSIDGGEDKEISGAGGVAEGNEGIINKIIKWFRNIFVRK